MNFAMIDFSFLSMRNSVKDSLNAKLVTISEGSTFFLNVRNQGKRASKV